MNTITIILQYLPQVINLIKKIKMMADDGLSKKEIENVLNKMELAFENISDDDQLAAELDDQWVRNSGPEAVHPPLPGGKSSKHETQSS